MRAQTPSRQHSKFDIFDSDIDSYSDDTQCGIKDSNNGVTVQSQFSDNLYSSESESIGEPTGDDPVVRVQGRASPSTPTATPSARASGEQLSGSRFSFSAQAASNAERARGNAAALKMGKICTSPDLPTSSRRRSSSRLIPPGVS